MIRAMMLEESLSLHFLLGRGQLRGQGRVGRVHSVALALKIYVIIITYLITNDYDKILMNYSYFFKPISHGYPTLSTNAYRRSAADTRGVRRNSSHARVQHCQRPFQALQRKHHAPQVKVELPQPTKRPRLAGPSTPAGGAKIPAETRDASSGK